ncbi:unnamed protein product [Caretta caretta]
MGTGNVRDSDSRPSPALLISPRDSRVGTVLRLLEPEGRVHLLRGFQRSSPGPRASAARKGSHRGKGANVSMLPLSISVPEVITD